MNGIGWTDYALLGLYAAGIFALGASRFRRGATSGDYFLASRQAGWFGVGISLMVSLASSLGYLAAPAAAQRGGLVLLWSLLALPLVYPLVVKVFIPFYHRLDTCTAYEYLERRFNLGVRLLASGLFIAWRLTWMAAVLYVPALALHAASAGRVPVLATLLVVGALATSYSMLGGMRGILWADIAQALVMFGGIGAALLIMHGSAPGGLAGLWEMADAAGRLQWTATIPGWEAAGWLERARLYLYADFTAGAIIISFTIGKLGNYGVDQVMIQRYLSAKAVQAAKRGFLLNCLAFALFFTLMILTGVALGAYAAQAGFPALRPDAVLPYFIGQAAPAGLAGLLLAGLLAAAVSSFDSGVNACTAALTNDFWSRLGRRAEVSTQIARVGTLLLGIAAVLLATQIGRLGDLFEIALKLLNSFLGPLLSLFLLGMFSRRAHARGVFWGTVLGAGCTAVLVFARPLLGVLEGAEGALALALLPWVKLLDIGFLWVSPLSLMITLSISYGLSLALRPASNDTRWTFQGIMAETAAGWAGARRIWA